MIGALIGLGTLLLSAITFLAGRAISESEKVLGEKRRVYEKFLCVCPTPSAAYENKSEEEIAQRSKAVQDAYPPFLLYAAPSVVISAGRYLSAFSDAEMELTPESPALHQTYKALARSHNDLILEMRRDALAWSAFGYRGESRLPKDWLEEAKRNAK